MLRLRKWRRCMYALSNCSGYTSITEWTGVMFRKCWTLTVLVLFCPYTDVSGAQCPMGKEVTLQASEERQIIAVQPSNHYSNTAGNIHCVWLIHSPVIHSSLVLQLLDLDIEDDTEDFVEIRECDIDECPDTCGEEFDAEDEDIDCHQWCEETGPQEEFETSDSCAHVELSLTGGRSERGLLLAFWSKPNEITVVGAVHLTMANYVLFGLFGLSVLGFGIAFLVVLNHRKWPFTLHRRGQRSRIIMVAPAPDAVED